MNPPHEHRSESAPQSGGAPSLTVKRGYSIAWAGQVFRPGDRIRRDHPCVPANQDRLVVVVDAPKPKVKRKPSAPTLPLVSEEGQEGEGE